VLPFIFIISLFGCATNRVPVSDYLRQQYTLEEARLQKLQVYVSENIVLERVTDTSGADIEAGELNVFGEKIEQIIISKKTPGIILEATDAWVKVSFSEGTWLYFGSVATEGGDDPWGGKYALFAEKWSGGIGYLKFNGFEYRAVKKSSQAVLEIRQKDLKKTVVEKNKLPGVQLGAE
jgi:hypothetical protein